MLKLIDNLNDEECYKIFNHDRFKALKDWWRVNGNRR